MNLGADLEREGGGGGGGGTGKGGARGGAGAAKGRGTKRVSPDEDSTPVNLGALGSMLAGTDDEDEEGDLQRMMMMMQAREDVYLNLPELKGRPGFGS